jgi:hypothetical protein
VAGEGTEEPGGIAGVNSRDGKILGNNCAGSNDYSITNRHREDRSICSDTNTIAKPGRPPELRVSGGSAGTEEVVNKHGTMRNEAVVANRDEIANE